MKSHKRSTKTSLSDLLVAISSGDENNFKRLLSPETANARDRGGQTPLMYAITEGNAKMVQALIAAGSEVNARNEADLTPLHFAAIHYRPEIAKQLIDAGAELEAKDSSGNTPLFRATVRSAGRGEMITLLLKKGANPNAKNKAGVSPLSLAKDVTNFDLLQFFK